MGGTPSVSLWTAATWTAPETQTRVRPSPPQPANLPSLCPTQRTGRICSVIHVSHILYKWFNLMHTLFFMFVMAVQLIFLFLFCFVFVASVLQSSFLWNLLHQVQHKLLRTRACPSLSLVQVSNFCINYQHK